MCVCCVVGGLAEDRVGASEGRGGEGALCGHAGHGGAAEEAAGGEGGQDAGSGQGTHRPPRRHGQQCRRERQAQGPLRRGLAQRPADRGETDQGPPGEKFGKRAQSKEPRVLSRSIETLGVQLLSNDYLPNLFVSTQEFIVFQERYSRAVNYLFPKNALTACCAYDWHAYA